MAGREPDSPYMPDDLAAFAVASAVVRTIATLSEDFEGDDEVWEAFIEERAPGSRAFFEAVRRSPHSIFFYQLQYLYEFGMERTARPPEEFCRLCGNCFMDVFFVENIYAFLQVALATPGAVKKTISDLLRAYLYRYAGSKYDFEEGLSPEGITLSLEYRHPEAMERYWRRYDLDAERCFVNSFYFIVGSFEGFVSKVIEGYDEAGLVVERAGMRGDVVFSIGDADRFAHERLIEILLGYVRQVEERQSALVEDERLESDLIVGSDLMRETWDRIRRASRTDEIVLLRGESGTGKSFIARKIHELSARREKPCIEVGLISDIGSDSMIQSDLFGHERGAFTGAHEEKQGLFSLADGGTIFLDEIGDASPELQAKLLRVIESSTFKRLGGVEDIEVDIRVIAATNRDLEKMVEDGGFRRDLYYRLNVIPIHLPPLRERPEEIPALAEFLLARAAARGKTRPASLSEELAQRLTGYGWPGNIRELDHALKHATAMAEGGEIGPAHFPEPVRAGLGEVSRAAPGRAAKRPDGDDVIDIEALRRAIARSDVLGSRRGDPTHEIPGHIDYAKRVWLAELIDYFGGDLSLIGRLWDRSSEKTLRKLVRAYDLAERLDAARREARGPD